VADIIDEPKGLPGLGNLSCKRNISTLCWMRKCSNSSFLGRTPSAFQQARRLTLQRSVLLWRAAIFGYKKNDCLKDGARASCPCGDGRDGRKKPTTQLHTCTEEKVPRRSDISSSGEVGLWVGTTTLGVVCVSAAVLTLAAVSFWTLGWWVGGLGRGSLDDTPPSDDVIPLLSQLLLLGRGTGLLSFKSGRLACGNPLKAAFGHLL